MSYQVGDVVMVDQVVDLQGQRAKCRPVVILELGDELLGVAITTQFGEPRGTHEIMVYDGKMANRTGLKKPSVVNADWLVLFNESEIVRKLGHVLPVHLRTILAYFSER
jgi:mRNA-degrading endonuclease toxin of MazEF toxin-antitoxin module